MAYKFWISVFIHSCLNSYFHTTLHGQTIKKMDNATWNAIDDQVETSYNTYFLKGISVAVIYGGNIAYANAFGNKNNNGDPFTIHTKSLLASISKTITGTLAMKLVENGDIDLNDDIGDYLPEYNNTFFTVRDLLCHQSGIAHYSDCPGGYSGPFDPAESLEVVLDCEICMTPPQSGTLYTTFGSTLLGVLIDDVGMANYGLSYQQLYNSWIRDPGGLTTLLPAYNNSDPDLAEGGEGELFWDDIGWKLPGGGFISDIIDLANYARGFLNNVYISQTTFNQMQTLQPTTGSPEFTCGESGSNSWGLSWAVSGSDIQADNFSISHSGSNDHGYSSYLVIYPNRNAAIALLSNTDLSGVLQQIANNIDDLVLCPASRDFTNPIDWTEPRIFEGEEITGRSLISTTYNEIYIFDAENTVWLKPGFHAPAGKTFKAQVTDGCAGILETD